jgi:hypothetical protein
VVSYLFSYKFSTVTIEAVSTRAYVISHASVRELSPSDPVDGSDLANDHRFDG